MGPLNDAMKSEMVKRQGDIKFDITWTTLGEYLDHLEKRHLANVASFVGATTVRDPRARLRRPRADADELARMQALVRRRWRKARSASARR